jgi:hypothetical protein
LITIIFNSNETNQEKESALVLNITNSIINSNENTFRITATETTTTHLPIKEKTVTTSPASVTSWIETTSTDDEINPLTVLECLPYVNSTDIDDLTPIIDRYNLPNKPEPELIALFHKNRRLSMDQLKIKLLKLKYEVISSVMCLTIS